MRKIIVALGVLVLAGGAILLWKQSSVEDIKGALDDVREDAEFFVTEVLPQKLTNPEPLKIFKPVSGNLTIGGVLLATNNERIESNLQTFEFSEALSKAADKKVDDMFARQYFEHESPDGKDAALLVKEQGYEYIVVGENLAMGNFKDDADLILAWMNSPGHRANILNKKFREIGISAKRGTFEGKSVWLAVQMFAAPASLCFQPSVVLRGEIDANRVTIAKREVELESKRAELESHKGTAVEYNRRVEIWNNLVNEYNTLVAKTKSDVAFFNLEVRKYNACIQLP